MTSNSLTRLHAQAVRSGWSRRRFLTNVGALAGAAAVGLPHIVRANNHGAALFSLGVASGDPTATSVVLWTRLAPDPLNGGGMGSESVEVRWEVATDPLMVNVVRSGTTTANPGRGHAVIVVASELAADTWYWYRFTALGEQSRIGRTRTFPARNALPERLRFALVSCQDYQGGYYAAYRDIVEQDVDFVLHLGDYIYEHGPSPAAVRQHNSGEVYSIEEYRNRYALYRLDPQLQDAHALYPFIVTWDDHEVDDNYADEIPEDSQAVGTFLERRANAYQAYREMMPLRPRYRNDGPDLHLFRRLHFGRLAAFHVLDTRQYRTDQPCGGSYAVEQLCEVNPAQIQIDAPDATMLGSTQEEWLFSGLRQSNAVWNVLAQQVMMMEWDLGSITDSFWGIPGLNVYNTDAWDGYRVARQRVLDFLATERPANPIVLTGDIHSAWAADLKRDFNDEASPVVGAEFVCTSITSEFGDANVPLVELTLPGNPHIKFFDGIYRGYTLCEVTPEAWTAQFRAVDRSLPTLNNPGVTVDSPMRAVAPLPGGTFVVRNGVPGINPV